MRNQFFDVFFYLFDQIPGSLANQFTFCFYPKGKQRNKDDVFIVLFAGSIFCWFLI